MNIGVDVDGVLVELESFQIEHGAKYFKKKYGYDIVNPAGFDVVAIFHCSEKERNRFWMRNFWKQIIFRPSREDAASILKKLHGDGHKIYVITGRALVTRRDFWGWFSRTLLKNWLKRRCIPYDEILYCSENNSAGDKVAYCEKYSIDIMVEDNAENIIAMSEFTEVICFDAVYNRDCAGENIRRAFDWNEIHMLIEASQH